MQTGLLSVLTPTNPWYNGCKITEKEIVTVNYIILDLEWNQPFDRNLMLKEPVMLNGEIIQIGAVKLDESYHLVDTFKIMVTPEYYRSMHRKVSKLTNIKTEDLQYGFPFKKAFKYFCDWCGDDFVFLTWGPDDIEILNKNMIIHEIDTEWLPDTYNLQIIFNNQHTKTKRQISLKHAMEYVCETALDAHDALNDARNTAKLCLHIDMNKGLVEYQMLENEFRNLPNHAVDRCRNGKIYKTREEALSDNSLLTFFCPKCGKQTVCVDFVRQNSDKYICFGKCENGEKYFVRFKFTKRDDGMFKVTRIIYETNEENVNYYNSKKQHRKTKTQMCSEQIA